jgi:hypothetical protein
MIIATGIAVNSTRGQSTFAVENFAGRPVLDAPVFDGSGNRLSGTNFLAALYGGATPGSLSRATVPPFTDLIKAPVPFTYMVAGQAGYFSGGVAEVPSDAVCGGSSWLQVRAWDARLGTTYEEVTRLGIGGYGQSNTFQDPGGDPCIPGGTAPGLLLGLQSFSLLPEVPEPSTWRLLVCGGFGAWLAVRRRHRPKRVQTDRTPVHGEGRCDRRKPGDEA